VAVGLCVRSMSSSPTVGTGSSAGRARRAVRGRAVRGIVLKNEELGLDEWIDALARDLAETAEQSERGRVALEKLLNE
jgi:hypothetical protein